MDGVPIGHEEDLIVRDPLGNIMLSLDDLEHPAFVLVDDHVCASCAGVSPLRHQLGGYPDAFPSCLGSLGDYVSDSVADPAVYQLGHILPSTAAAIACYGHTPFVDECVAEGGFPAGPRLGPKVCPCFGDLRDLGALRLKSEEFTWFVGGSRDFVLDHGVVSGVIFVVSEEDFSGSRGFLAYNHRAAVVENGLVYPRLSEGVGVIAAFHYLCSLP